MKKAIRRIFIIKIELSIANTVQNKCNGFKGTISEATDKEFCKYASFKEPYVLLAAFIIYLPEEVEFDANNLYFFKFTNFYHLGKKRNLYIA